MRKCSTELWGRDRTFVSRSVIDVRERERERERARFFDTALE